MHNLKNFWTILYSWPFNTKPICIKRRHQAYDSSQDCEVWWLISQHSLAGGFFWRESDWWLIDAMTFYSKLCEMYEFWMVRQFHVKNFGPHFWENWSLLIYVKNAFEWRFILFYGTCGSFSPKFHFSCSVHHHAITEDCTRYIIVKV